MTGGLWQRPHPVCHETEKGLCEIRFLGPKDLSACQQDGLRRVSSLGGAIAPVGKPSPRWGAYCYGGALGGSPQDWAEEGKATESIQPLPFRLGEGRRLRPRF